MLSRVSSRILSRSRIINRGFFSSIYDRQNRIKEEAAEINRMPHVVGMKQNLDVLEFQLLNLRTA